jgi:hypothetical protein
VIILLTFLFGMLLYWSVSFIRYEVAVVSISPDVAGFHGRDRRFYCICSLFGSLH